jgi:hypothetical protein
MRGVILLIEAPDWSGEGTCLHESHQTRLPERSGEPPALERASSDVTRVSCYAASTP